MATRQMRSASIILALLTLLLFTSCGKKEGEGTGGADSTAAMSGGEGSATAEETANIALSREFIEKAINNADTAFAREHIDAAFVEHSPSPGQKTGIEGFMEWVVMNKAAFPDIKLTIENIFAKGDQVAIVSTLTGTNTGPMMGKPATGKSVSMQVVDVVKIKNGKMTDHWGQADVMKMMTDLGMMPAMDGGSHAGGGASASGDSGSATGDGMKTDTAK